MTTDNTKNTTLLQKVMHVVMMMYAVKAFVKYYVGSWIGSPAISGDAIHNAVDLAEGGLVLWGFRLAKRPPSKEYPLGQRNAESILVLLTGLSLFIPVVMLLRDTAAGILSHLPTLDQPIRSAVGSLLPEAHQLQMNGKTFLVTWFVVAFSASLSLVVSRWQIRVGKKERNDSMVANGQETWSDARIELATVVALPLEYFFHLYWVEYLLGVIVAVLVTMTAWELTLKGYHILQQHAIERDHTEAVTTILNGTPGVRAGSKVTAFAIGSGVECWIDVVTVLPEGSRRHLREFLEQEIGAYLAGQEFANPSVCVAFEEPVDPPRRVAWALYIEHGRKLVARSLEAATELRFGDERAGGVFAPHDMLKPSNPADLLALLRSKNVKEVRVYDTGTPSEQRLLRDAGITYVQTDTFLPEILGIT